MKTAHILVHGLADGQAEAAYLKDYLIARGLDSHTIQIDNARTQIAEIAQNYDDVVLIGVSGGGLILANLAREFENAKTRKKAMNCTLKKAIFVNTPIRFLSPLRLFGHLLRAIRTREFAPFRRHFLLACKSSRKISEIKCDTFVIQNDEHRTQTAELLLKEIVYTR